MTRPFIEGCSLSLWSMGLLTLLACTPPRVAEEQQYFGPLPRPDRVLVHDFAVTPTEVKLDSGLRGRLTQAFSSETTSEQQYAAARETSAAMTAALAAGLQRYGLPVDRTSSTEAPGPGRFVLVDGQVLAVDEGNRTRRVMIGLGRGMSSVEIGARAYYLDGRAAPRPLESFNITVDSGYAPGAAETMGAGAVAGRAATSAAVGGGAHAAIEGGRADDVDEAKRAGHALAERIGKFFVRQGWAVEPSR
jgi:Domain of unknown function (DUF4410)